MLAMPAPRLKYSLRSNLNRALFGRPLVYSRNFVWRFHQNRHNGAYVSPCRINGVILGEWQRSKCPVSNQNAYLRWISSPRGRLGQDEQQTQGSAKVRQDEDGVETSSKGHADEVQLFGESLGNSPLESALLTSKDLGKQGLPEKQSINPSESREAINGSPSDITPLQDQGPESIPVEQSSFFSISELVAAAVARREQVRSPVPKELRSLRNSVSPSGRLEEELSWRAHHRPNLKMIYDILQRLVKEYHIKPTTVHYEALILANCDPMHGSIDAVKELLREMESERIAIGASTYHAALRVLSVHPDHLFHAAVLARMQKQWIPTSPSSSISSIASYIRTGQLEVALTHLTTLYRSHRAMLTRMAPGSAEDLQNQIPDYPLIALLHQLAEVEDFPGVLHLLYLAEDHQVHLSTSTYLVLLDRAAECHALDVVRHIWDVQVELSYLVPPAGLCHQVLLAASRVGDVALAESVVKVLGQRRMLLLPRPTGQTEKTDDARGESELAWTLLTRTYQKAGMADAEEKLEGMRIKIAAAVAETKERV